MASPHVFRSSPSRAKRQEFHVVRSSSPDLPPLQDFLPQKPSRPPLRSGSKAAPIPENAPVSFVPAGSMWRSAPAATEALVIEPVSTSTMVKAGNAEVPMPIVETAPKSTRIPKPRKPRKRKGTATPDITVEAKQVSKSPEGDKPWKKYQSPPRAINGKESALRKETEAQNDAVGHGRKTETTSKHFTPELSIDPRPKPQKKISDEPLHLEPAAARRVDWTPPPQETVINLDSDSSVLRPLDSPATTGGQTSRFKNLLQSYTCQQEEPQAANALSDEDSSFLKKRKLIELVVTKDSNSATPAVLEKSPIKQKAPKKKPRTITAIATAAYKQATQQGPIPPPASQLNLIPADGVASETSTTDAQAKGKGKAKPRKRAPKASKKKAPPPKPILLSPGTALQQVAKQDFVFGTSSQLAREPSPTLLRDIQAAMRHSNHIDDDDFMTPINSDTIEPPERRPKLWEAGNRDAEGDLFDIEVINLVDGSPQLPPLEGDVDPFGYFKADDAVTAADTNIISLASDDSFINLSDILPAPTGDCTEIIDEGSPFSPKSDISASTNIAQQPCPSVEGIDTPPTTCRTDESVPAKDLPTELNAQSHLPRPGYELYTDIQLAKEITSYGFKPVKRRNAMIALLDQCWRSKVKIGQAGVHTSATLSAASKSNQAASTLTLSPKKPRGRPRKTSIGAPEPQEPPPSAQPASSPPLSPSTKRARGRPRNNAASPSKTSSSRAKPRSPKKVAPAPSTPQRKRMTVQTPIEIPDSASDNLSDFASSPGSSSPEELFSSPPLDLSLDEDTEVSLVASQDDQQAALFSHITKAITTAPRTTDPSNPSWHEKILLYDPIILEDMTAWLNSGQLTRVGCDEEVFPGLVKKWCESKSICSVWRVNLRGQERKRF